MKYRILLVMLLMFMNATVAQAKSEKVTICHIPPGNPANAHTITVSENALAAHLSHGDTRGPCPPTSTTIDTVAVYTDVFGPIHNYNAITGLFELDGDIIVMLERIDFDLTEGLVVYVRGFQLFNGWILAFDASPSTSLLDPNFDVTTDMMTSILLDVTGMITFYDHEHGTITIDNQIVVILLVEAGAALQPGMFVTVSGELLPDGRILADMVIPFSTNVVIDFETADQKVTICHAPPGNPPNAHNIRVSGSATPAHLAHGDVLGPCAGTDANAVITCGHDACDAVAVTLVDTGVTFEDVESLRAQGYGMGEIARVYLLAAQAGVTPQEIIAKRNSGMGWGNIMHDYPNIQRSELAPSILIGNGRGKSIRTEEDGLPGRANGNGKGKGNSKSNGKGNN